MNLELEELVEDYKKDHNQENYNNIITKLFTNIEQELILPSVIRKDNNGFELKSSYDFNGNSYLVTYTSEKFVTDKDETFIVTSLKGIINNIIMKNDNCFGFIINPDKKINETNQNNQCIIPKDHIIKLLKMM